MEIAFHANMMDTSTERVAKLVRSAFDKLNASLSGDYGGTLEHLWIDLELVRARSTESGGAKWPFRIQRRVSGASRFGLPAIPDRYNVGHYSIRPNYQVLLEAGDIDLLKYVLALIYDSFSVLEEKKKRMGNFDTQLLRNRFVEVCIGLGIGLDALVQVREH